MKPILKMLTSILIATYIFMFQSNLSKVKVKIPINMTFY